MNLYIPPRKLQDGPLSRDMFCRSRTKLLEAMGGGGRVGFDAAYVPAGEWCQEQRNPCANRLEVHMRLTLLGCHYRWYNVEEICMILERFDGLLFVGDETLKDVYAGFNILLREDLSLGAMKQWEMNDDNMKTCKCEQQFINEGCAKFRVDASEQVTTNIGSTKNPSMASFTCQRTSHAFLAIDAFPISAPTIDAFNKLVPKAPQSHYKHIPILYSLTSPHSTSAATKNMDELILYADATKRKTPMLWVGPTAAGHLDGKAGHQDIWRFSAEMVQAAHDRDVESLSLWNMTVQASSYDGKGFSEGVAITQAMMVSTLSIHLSILKPVSILLQYSP